MAWNHVGGGCELGSTDTHPCHDIYQDEETETIVYFKTTVAAHYSLPERTVDIREIRAMPGVVILEVPDVVKFDWGSVLDGDA